MEDWGFTSIRLAQVSAATAGSVPTFTPLSKIYTSEQLREAGDSHTLLSDAHKRQWAQVEGQEILFKCVEKHFPGGEEQELVAQRGCRGSKWVWTWSWDGPKGAGLEDVQRPLAPQPSSESATEYGGRSLNFELFKLSKLKLLQFLKILEKGEFSSYKQFISADLPDRRDEYLLLFSSLHFNKCNNKNPNKLKAFMESTANC